MSRLFPILLLLAGCATRAHTDPPPTPSVALGEEFTLAEKASARLAGSGYFVTFKEVLEDSRCPTGVSCIWEGNARVGIYFIEYDALDEHTVEISDEFTVELNTSARFQASATRSGFRVELKRLDPAPRADTPTTGYVATLSITDVRPVRR